ncbi:hypothetical protein IMCC3317_05650 [Kordia antarctica]|uniref:Glycosyltransferase RgtA/B/C/D-like domain-containing protein n=1 Tax=Kordia antarctica TaxID=1218801 RepID=A0A7L4ZFE7_9FLAO|nr:hypothetical protein [Kordia antarctica]QHI35219.1 hypothetical protein IMCC3317_05650 [Kordia antarctica]
MNRKHVLVILLNICIAFGYYLGNLSANETQLSSDLHNIIPVCLKKDDPSLFAKDLFCNDINNVKYYTPFYVETLRFLAKFTDGNYVQALNILTFICHILFGLLWYFLLFRITKNFWIALLISVFMRGIIWIPGNEYWGISDLWSMLPRVVYYAVMPLPFLLINFKNNTKLYLAAFLAGLLFNFHPITGLGGVLLFLSCVLLHSYYEKKKFKILFSQRNFIVILLAFAGMLPFFLTYFGNVSTATDYSLETYQKALELKFSSFLSEPTTFWYQWLRLKYIIYFLPVFLFIGYAKFKGNHKDKTRSFYVLWLSLIVFILPNLVTYVELFVNLAFDLNIRMSFQLVRIQKLLILAFFFSVVFILDIFYKNERFKQLFPFLFGGFLLLLIVSKHTIFDKIPFILNDITRCILPNSLSIGTMQNSIGDEDLNEVLLYIREHTPKDALFYAPDIGRSGGRRSVDLDSKGANMLIEGNPKRFVQWYEDYHAINSLPTRLEGNQFLRDYGVEYVLIYIDLPEFELLFQKGKWRLYKVTK